MPSLELGLASKHTVADMLIVTKGRHSEVTAVVNNELLLIDLT